MDFRAEVRGDIGEGAVKELFDKSVEAYRKNFTAQRSGKNFAFRRRLELVQDFIANSRGHLLDCAVGTGEITAAMLTAGHFEQATLVDLSPKMLQHAREVIGKDSSAAMQFVEGSIFTKVPPAQDRYDCIACLGLIAHTGRLEELLSLFRKSLKRNGMVLLQCTLAEHWGTRLTRAFARLRSKRIGYEISYFTRDQIRAAAEKCGFTVEKEVRYAVGLPFADRIWAAGNYYLEKLADGRTKRGAEAVFLLRPKG